MDPQVTGISTNDLPPQSKADRLKERSKRLAVRVIRLSRSLKKNQESKVISNQLIRAATSVAANYRAVCRARSRKEFIAKLGIVVEEADETLFWLEMLVELGDVSPAKVSALQSEANELVSIFVASKRTSEQSPIDNRQSPIANRLAGKNAAQV